MQMQFKAFNTDKGSSAQNVTYNQSQNTCVGQVMSKQNGLGKNYLLNQQGKIHKKKRMAKITGHSNDWGLYHSLY